MAFESWAIVEIMGHVRIAGKVSEQVIAGAAMLRIDVPKTNRREEYTKFYGSSAVYSITPTSEEIASAVAERLDEPPVALYLLPTSPMLASKVVIEDESDEETAYDEDTEQWHRYGD